MRDSVRNALDRLTARLPELVEDVKVLMFALDENFDAIPVSEIPDHLNHDLVYREVGTEVLGVTIRHDELVDNEPFWFEVNKSRSWDADHCGIYCLDCRVVVAIEDGPIRMETS